MSRPTCLSGKTVRLMVEHYDCHPAEDPARNVWITFMLCGHAFKNGNSHALYGHIEACCRIEDAIKNSLGLEVEGGLGAVIRAADERITCGHLVQILRNVSRSFEDEYAAELERTGSGELDVNLQGDLFFSDGDDAVEEVERRDSVRVIDRNAIKGSF